MPKTSKPSSQKKNVTEVVADKAGFLRPHDSVQKAAERLREAEVPNVPVVEGRKLIGAIDQENLDQQVAKFGHDPNLITVGETMNRQIVYCFEDQDCAEALKIMDQFELKYLPVVDRDLRVIGSLRREDLIQGAT